MEREKLISAIKDVLADKEFIENFGSALLLGAADLTDPMMRPEVDAFVDGLLSRIAAS